MNRHFPLLGVPKRSELQLNLQGSTLMPMFFMLSGFALAATYGRKLWAAPRPLLPSSACCARSRPPPPGSAMTSVAAVEEGRWGAGVNEEAEQQQEQPPAPLPRFPLQSFYQNRFARVMPVYYFCLLLCLPLWGLNVGDLPFSRKTFVPSLLTSVFACTTLVSGAPLATLNPPGWFVCTLVWFFLLFPRWLAAAQRLSDAQLLRRIVWHYYLQYALLQGIFSLLPLVAPGFRPFGVAATNPLTRLPLFLMGIYAGLLALRHPAPKKQQQPPADQAHTPTPTPTAPTVTTVTVGKEKGAAAGEQGVGAAVAVVAGGSPRAAEERKMMLTLTAAAPTAAQEKGEEVEKGGGGEGREPMPWPACFLGCFPLPPALAASRCGRALLLPLSTKPLATQRDWARVATWQGVGALFFTLGIAAADSYLAVRTRGRVVLRGHVWMQGLVPMVQLNILVALTRDGRLSLASRALGTSLAQWLGKVSMDVYLVHWPIIAYTALALHGPRRFETLLDCYGAVDARKEDPAHYDTCVEAMAAAKRFPPWGILIILPLALAAGELLRRYVNEPARRLLRARGPRQQQERQQEQVTATKSAAGE